MTIDEVIRTGRFTQSESFENGVSLLAHGEYVFVMGLIVLTVGLSLILFTMAYVYEGGDYTFKWKMWHVIVNGMAVAVASFLTITITGHFATDGKVYDRWLTDTVYPYVDALPVTKVKVEAVKRIDESKTPYLGVLNGKEVIPVSVLYASEEGNAKTIEANALILFDEDGGQPYMEYKRLSKPLSERVGNEIPKGITNLTLHLPKGYYFNQ